MTPQETEKLANDAMDFILKIALGNDPYAVMLEYYDHTVIGPIIKLGLFRCEYGTPSDTWFKDMIKDVEELLVV